MAGEMLGISRVFSNEPVAAASSRSSSLGGGVSAKGRSRGLKIRDTGSWLEDSSGKPSIWESPFVSRTNYPPAPAWLAKEGLASPTGDDGSGLLEDVRRGARHSVPAA
jgi:hypothetical protein